VSVTPATTRRAIVAPVVEVPPGTMPDVIGLSGREATARLHRAGLEVRVSGSGRVASQTPQAGEALPEGGWVALALRRQGVSTGAGGGR
jgi:beta-lactam-binding protein with PASTA domain